MFASASSAPMGLADRCAFCAYFGGLMMENYAPDPIDAIDWALRNAHSQ
jgi:hypothetical protein